MGRTVKVVLDFEQRQIIWCLRLWPGYPALPGYGARDAHAIVLGPIARPP